MPRLIDADKLKSYFAPTLTGRTEYSADEILLTIATMPTVDAEPVRHGHWINHYDDLFPEESMVECSLCHEYECLNIDTNYCPNCGAKMDEVEDG